MTRQPNDRNPTPRSALFLILAVALALAACDNDIEITAPQIPTSNPGVFTSSEWVQTLHISGTLSAAQGSCLEATILFDGQEIVGARTACFTPDGCATLELRGRAFSVNRGQHTIAFRVLRQSPQVVEYQAAGNVLVELSHLSYDMPLGPAQATLGSGESVIFDATIEP